MLWSYFKLSVISFRFLASSVRVVSLLFRLFGFLSFFCHLQNGWACFLFFSLLVRSLPYVASLFIGAFMIWTYMIWWGLFFGTFPMFGIHVNSYDYQLYIL